MDLKTTEPMNIEEAPEEVYLIDNGADAGLALNTSTATEGAHILRYYREDTFPVWHHPTFGSDLPEVNTQVVFEAPHPNDSNKMLRTLGVIIETPMDRRVELGRKLVQIPGESMAMTANDIMRYFPIPPVPDKAKSDNEF